MAAATTRKEKGAVEALSLHEADLLAKLETVRREKEQTYAAWQRIIGAEIVLGQMLAELKKENKDES